MQRGKSQVDTTLSGERGRVRRGLGRGPGRRYQGKGVHILIHCVRKVLFQRGPGVGEAKVQLTRGWRSAGANGLLCTTRREVVQAIQVRMVCQLPRQSLQATEAGSGKECFGQDVIRAACSWSSRGGSGFWRMGFNQTSPSFPLHDAVMAGHITRGAPVASWMLFSATHLGFGTSITAVSGLSVSRLSFGFLVQTSTGARGGSSGKLRWCLWLHFSP